MVQVQSAKLQVCLALLACFSVAGAMAQSAAPVTSPDIYAMAVRAAAEEEAKTFSGQKGFDGLNLVFVRAETTQKLPATLGPFHLVVLDFRALRDRFSRQGTFRVHEVSPALIEGSFLRINVGDSWYSFQGFKLFHHRHNQLAVEGSAEVLFRYDCGKQEFVVDHVTLWGI